MRAHTHRGQGFLPTKQAGYIYANLPHRTFRLQSCGGPYIFLNYRLQDFFVQAEIGDQMLQLAILFLQPFEPLRIAHVHAAELRLPRVDRRFADADLPGQFGHFASRLVLLQDPDNLLFCGTAPSSFLDLLSSLSSCADSEDPQVYLV